MQKKTSKEIREEINQWKMLEQAGPEMLEETKNRIEALKKIMAASSDEQKAELQKNMNELQYILAQTSKNVEVTPSVILNLEEEYRKTFRKEMAQVCHI